MADCLEAAGDNEDSVSNRHRKERKELQAKIQSLKKTASKGDKKKRKEVLEEIAKLEIDLDKKHAQELDDVNNAKNFQNVEQTASAEESNPQNYLPDEDEEKMADQNNTKRISKAQKRRDKKAKEEREREAEIEAQEEINKNGPRVIELQTIKKKLMEKGLALHSIPSDGDCLYKAVIHQLEVTGRNTYDVGYLRNKTASYILENKDSLICYMTSQDTGNLLTDEELLKYCDSIRSTPAWGGQVEINALSHILKVPIEVLQATGPPTVQGEHEFLGPPLVLTYHRLMYSLGEHYNSTKPETSGNADNGEQDSIDSSEKNV